MRSSGATSRDGFHYIRSPLSRTAGPRTSLMGLQGEWDWRLHCVLPIGCGNLSVFEMGCNYTMVSFLLFCNEDEGYNARLFQFVPESARKKKACVFPRKLRTRRVRSAYSFTPSGKGKGTLA